MIHAQVDEIRRRQSAGLIDAGLDPRFVRLLGFALASYPRLLPQITRMTTGTAPEDPDSSPPGRASCGISEACWASRATLHPPRSGIAR